MRVPTLLKRLLGLCRESVVTSWQLDEECDRPSLLVGVRAKARRRGRCGRCGTLARGTTRADAVMGSLAGGGMSTWGSPLRAGGPGPPGRL